MINVCDIQVMKPLLAEHGFHFSKAKGQNFLTQRWVPDPSLWMPVWMKLPACWKSAPVSAR